MMARMKEGHTSATAAHSSSESLRTTIPAHVTKKLGIARMDVLVWDIDKVDGEWTATIRKA